TGRMGVTFSLPPSHAERAQAVLPSRRLSTPPIGPALTARWGEPVVAWKRIVRSAPAVSTRPQVIVRVYGCTDVGRTRDHNEDAFVVADLSSESPLDFDAERTEEPGDRGAVLMVADGMGGAAAGEIASSMAVEVVLRELRSSWI